METKEIIESGFVKAFIVEYFEDKIYSFYSDKDRLLYVLCSTDIEKQQVTAKLIEVAKSEIQKLGNEDLSFAYLLSCKPESISGPNYIEPDKRFDFWLNKFCEVFIDSINTFTPIFEACKLFKTEISNEDFENEFWEIYPASQKPKENCLPFVIQREFELLNEIEYTISEYKENEYWEFDFEEYQKFIDTSKPIELLFNVSELLVQLYRLENFNEFLLPPQQIETKTDQETQTENNVDLSTIEDWLYEFKEKMNDADYQKLVLALLEYFETGIFPTLSKPIQINGRLNKKLFGWALNRIFEAKGKGIEKELLQFAKQNISLYTNVQFDETNILQSNLYKYFTTKTK